MIVHACVEAALALFDESMRGHGNDREFLQTRIPPQQLGCREPVHLRHLQIHEYDVERRSLIAFGQDFHRFSAMVGNGYDRAGALQQFSRNLLVHLVVFYQQNPDSGGVMHRRSSFFTRER